MGLKARQVRKMIYLTCSLNKAGNTANFQAGDISRRKKVKEKRPSPFLLRAQPLKAAT
jgi:hypothetical protein